MMKKSRTFELSKSPCSQSLKKSGQLILGEEMLHFGHPQHPLSLIDLPDLFTCHGCREFGAGRRFVCQHCDFQLHDFCGYASPVLKAHPLHRQHQLLLFAKPVKTGIVQNQAKCDVCNKSTKGYAFRCSACSFQMHPCCSMLSSEIKWPWLHPHTLTLLPLTTSSTSTTPTDSSLVCSFCNISKRSGRAYHCTVCDYHLHAACAKNFVNGLYHNGIRPKDIKPSMLSTAARVAGQVVIEFIGGLIEGLAEGVGQVIVQDMAKGRITSDTAATSSSSSPIPRINRRIN